MASNATFLASTSLGSTKAFHYLAGWPFLCHWPGNATDLAFSTCKFSKVRTKPCSCLKLNTNTPSDASCGLCGVSLDLVINGFTATGFQDPTGHSAEGGRCGGL